MIKNIDRLITALNKEVEFSAEEIADTIWLAMQMNRSLTLTPLTPLSKGGTGSRVASDSTAKEKNSSGSEELDKETSKGRKEEPKAGVYSHNPAKPRQSSELSLKVPDAAALREPLTLARAFKPLMRRMPSGGKWVLDEAATIERIADQRLWLPVLKPTLEPWLDIELVVDEGISMHIWRRTIRELERLLKNYGIFRNVRVWGLTTHKKQDETEEITVQIRRGLGRTAKNQSPRSPKELIDPTGRRLVLVVSDCVSALWRDGGVNAALGIWANNMPTAIIQMLPKWLWERSALGRLSEVLLRSLSPGVANRYLIAKQVSFWNELDPNTGIKVPIFTLEGDRVKTWAQMLSGQGSVWTDGYVFQWDTGSSENKISLFNPSPGKLTAEKRVQMFRVTASPMARKLAGLLAAAPVITLPVVRLIREALLRDSLQVNVAEVFLGGLLKPLSEIRPDTNPDYVEYDFMDGVRELLLDSVPTDKVLNVLESVSEYVARKVGKSMGEFQAVLSDPQQFRDSDRASVQQVRPFAMVTAQILKELGGEYAKFAQKLKQAWVIFELNVALLESQPSYKDKWDEQLQKLALEVQRHPPQSPARSRALTQLIQAVQQSGKLSRKKLDCPQEVYDEALQEVWLYVYGNIDTYNPAKWPVINWINYLLKRQLYVLKRQLIDTHKRHNKSSQETALYKGKWDEQLQQLALEAQRHPPQSPARSRALTQLIQAVQQSGKLSRKKSDCPQEFYDEALQEVWLYVYHKIDKYHPEKEPVINWINFVLKRRLIDAHKRHNKSGKESSLDRPIASSQPGMTYLDNLPQPDKTPLPSQLVRQCIEDDPDSFFANRHIRGNPQANFRTIALLRLEGKYWKDIAIAVGLKPQQESTVRSFYSRSCKHFASILQKYLQT